MEEHKYVIFPSVTKCETHATSNQKLEQGRHGSVQKYTVVQHSPCTIM